uniref:Phosphoprotein n=1 Tax=Riverside virus 1 TaxID=1803263 RepID=A0A140D052_9RHAB|nr:phosphoprotein [Riverside virus 1]
MDNKSAVFAKANVFANATDVSARQEAQPGQVTAGRGRGKKPEGKKNTPADTNLHVNPNSRPGRVLDPNRILNEDKLGAVLDPIGEGGLDPGLSEEAPITTGAVPKKFTDKNERKILQVGPSRESKSGGSEKAAVAVQTSGIVTSSRQNLQLQRTQTYLPEDRNKNDFDSTGLAGGGSDSSTTTLLERESEPSDYDFQTIAECHELGLYAGEITEKSKFLSTELAPDRNGVTVADEVLVGINLMMSQAIEFTEKELVSFRLEGKMLIGDLRKKASGFQSDPVWIKQKSHQDDPPLRAPIVKPTTLPAKKRTFEPVALPPPESKQETSKPPVTVQRGGFVQVVMPRKKGGKPIIVEYPFDECLEILESYETQPEQGKAILRANNAYNQFVLTCRFREITINTIRQ